MMDQHSKFLSLGLSTEFVGEIQTDKSVIRKVLNGEVQLVYITPENVIDIPMYRNMLVSEKYKENLVALVIYEAQCFQV